MVMNFWATLVRALPHGAAVPRPPAPCAFARRPGGARGFRGRARGADVAGFVKARGFAFRCCAIRAVPWRRGELACRGYPTTFVIDRAFRLRERYLGVAEWDRPEALDHFRGLLRESTSPTR